MYRFRGVVSLMFPLAIAMVFAGIAAALDGCSLPSPDGSPTTNAPSGLRTLTPTTEGIPFIPEALARGVAPYPGTELQYYRHRDLIDRAYSWSPGDGSDGGFYGQSGVLVQHDLAGGLALAGTITADNLKPCFAYQVKLEGQSTQPRLSAAGKPKLYDLSDPINWANEQLGKVGRWWCMNDGWNVADSELSRHRGHVIRGYLLFDSIVTDATGHAQQLINLDSSFHVLWRTFGPGQRTQVPGTDGEMRWYTVDSTPVGVYAEWEPNRPLPGAVSLEPGTYQCRLLMTEESFHNDPASLVTWGVTHYADGGFWAHALSDEALEFVIEPSGPPPSEPVIHIEDVTVWAEVASPSVFHAGKATVLILNGDGSPVEGATVTGNWAFNGSALSTSSAVTGSNGVAELRSSRVRAASGIFELSVTGVSKSGCTYDPLANVESGGAASY